MEKTFSNVLIRIILWYLSVVTSKKIYLTEFLNKLLRKSLIFGVKIPQTEGKGQKETDRNIKKQRSLIKQKIYNSKKIDFPSLHIFV